MIQKRPCVYILTSRRNGTLYIGVTSDLALRVWQHRSNAVAGPPFGATKGNPMAGLGPAHPRLHFAALVAASRRGCPAQGRARGFWRQNSEATFQKEQPSNLPGHLCAFAGTTTKQVSGVRWAPLPTASQMSRRAYQPCREERFRCFTRAASPRTIRAAVRRIRNDLERFFT
jgi:hypothetical protein